MSGNMLADDPGFFGGFAFIAEFTADGKAKKANSWGSSPELGVVQSLPTLLEAQDGQILAFDATSLGEDDAFTLWTQP